MMHRFGPAGFISVIGALLGGLTIYASYRMTQRASVELEDKGTYAAVNAECLIGCLKNCARLRWRYFCNRIRIIGESDSCLRLFCKALILVGKLVQSKLFQGWMFKKVNGMSPDEILTFWLDDVGEKGWYEADDHLDKTIRDRFYASWIKLCVGSFGLWLTYPSGALAYILLADQFSRNMFRRHKNAFVSDRKGVAAAKSSVKRGWDLRIDEPARQFFYLPLMHSENLSDQDRCVRLVLERMPQTGASTLDHAKAHRAVIRQFGRFPYRNHALERSDTNLEREYLANGGYGFTLQKFLK